MRVLVTGGAGFIGSHIVDALLLRGHDVWVIDNYSSGYDLNIPSLQMGVNVFERDVSRWLSVIDLVEKFKPDVICHQAAQPSLRRSIDDPAYDATVNIIGTLNVIQAARACGAHVVFASTSAVYDTSIPREHVFAEDDDLGPNTPYGIAKMTAETYLRQSGASYTILRYGNVYGPRQVQVGENQLIPHCLAHIFDGKPFVINGDGKQTRDFICVRDVAEANILAIEKRPQGTFNIGTGEGTSVNDICASIKGIAHWPGMFEYGPSKAGEARHVALDSRKALETFGWRAQRSCLGEAINWWKER